MTLALISGRKLLIAFAFAAGISPAYATVSVSDAAEDRNEAIVREAFEKWGTGGNVFEILSPDVVWTIHGSGPVAKTYTSLEEFTAEGSRPLVSRLSGALIPEVHHIWAVDDRVIIRFDASSTTTSGNAYNNQFVWIFRLDDGAVVEAEAFLDLVAYQEVVDNNEPRTQ